MLRIYLDSHELNKALMREQYIMPILEDLLHDMRDAKVFTKEELSSGYRHVKLSEASSNLTMFQTCFSQYRWCQLSFGLNSAAKIFQRKLMEQFQDMKSIVIIANNLVVYRMNQEHDRQLQKCSTMLVGWLGLMAYQTL